MIPLSGIPADARSAQSQRRATTSRSTFPGCPRCRSTPSSGVRTLSRRLAARIGFRVEHYPFGLLTMIVSLEAIFLSTFVLISQNRADEKRQVMADHQWQTVL